MNTTPIYRFGRNFAIVTLCALLVVGCGKEKSPPGSSLTVSPSTLTWTGLGGACGGPMQDHLIHIVARNGFGIPLEGMKLRMSLYLTDNTFNGASVVWLYTDNGGVIGTLVSAVGQPAYETETSSSGGDVYMWLRLDLGCAWKGSLYIFGDNGLVATVDA